MSTDDPTDAFAGVNLADQAGCDKKMPAFMRIGAMKFAGKSKKDEEKNQALAQLLAQSLQRTDKLGLGPRLDDFNKVSGISFVTKAMAAGAVYLNLPDVQTHFFEGTRWVREKLGLENTAPVYEPS
jgi:hypothetical protein